MFKGLFISVEGLDGVGKTTQVAALGEWLGTVQRRPLLLVREPGGTALGDAVRQWVVEGGLTVSPTAELFLFAAARAELVHTRIGPHLKAGGLVLADRFVDSTAAYQGFGRGLGLAAVDAVNRLATGGLLPDLTVWLDGPAYAGGRDRFERLDAGFYRRVREGYQVLWEREPQRIRRVDGHRPAEQVQAEIRTLIGELLQKREERQ